MEDEEHWETRKIYIFNLICQVIAISNVNSIPVHALNEGVTGYTISLAFFYIFIGIPMLFIESVVAQFTRRDCIDAWKIRPCFSIIGYIQLLWQFFILINNHTASSFLLYYFLISFENPIPFYTCGPWSSKNCKSVLTNYTVNQDCFKFQNIFPYCDYIHQTFSEYQYWRFYVLKVNKEGYDIAWRVSLASGLICFMMFLSCFKRHKSLSWAFTILAFYPMIALVLLLIGSMLQKGLVAKYEEVLDLEFTQFVKKFRLSNAIQQVVLNTGIGSGITFNLASSLPFRSPSFSDIVIAVVICSIFSVMFVFTIAMMFCPYSYEYKIKPINIIKPRMSLVFEKIPRLLYEYNHKTYYLVIIFSCAATLGLCTNVIVLFNVLEAVRKRHPRLAKYPGLMTFCAVIIMFLVTIPFLSYEGISEFPKDFRCYTTIFLTFLAILECILFIFWYGIHRFSEDIHFMLGIQVGSCMTVAWILVVILLAYSFSYEVYYQVNNTLRIHNEMSYFFLGLLGILIAVFILRILLASFRRKFRKFISLDPTWGPESELLRRSRAMFSAQAMTKEYIYRQYHLQAGIIERQRKSNKRFVEE